MRVAALYKQEKEIKIIHLHEANAFSENHKAEHFDLIDITSEKKKNAGNEMGRNVDNYIGFLKL